jgi:hypothetical protein
MTDDGSPTGPLDGLLDVLSYATCRAPVFRSRSSERQMQVGSGRKIATDCL